ncbi:hypothetical protein [Acidovorax sp. SUPP3334]|uniref:hypothetical protein n=1 Tax=Acidovorax sp. SUPP3334 TaxID=2920881 RepID=UPI0023DE4B5E|nr:hypothetical protein [Acidovorax sp. SUPP3334]GKT25807.1 hypothetical protein AVHM3334_19145 [Acidovorax sp. SUPP3334]
MPTPDKSVTVASPQRFSDGSVRPDSLIAKRQTAAVLHNAKTGTPITTGNHFEIPGYVMSSGLDAHSDSHMHPTNYVQRGLNPQQLLKMMDDIGVRNTTLMPIPTSLLQAELPGADGATTVLNPHEISEQLGGSEHAHHCGPLEFYYVPKSIEDRVLADPARENSASRPKLDIDDFRKNPDLIKEIVNASILYVDTAVNTDIATAIKNSGMSEAQRSRLDPMITGLHLGDPRVSDRLLHELYKTKGTFTGIGEITVHKELVEDMFAGGRLQASTQTGRMEPLTKLLEVAGVVGTPVVLHCDIDNLHDQVADFNGKGKSTEARPPANLEGLRKMFSDPRVKDTQIVWAHGGGLGRFVQQGEGHIDALEKLLNDCPNLNLDISWSEVAKQISKDDQSLTAWRGFIEKHSERISFGSDTLAPKETGTWEATKKMYDEGLFQGMSAKAKHDVLNGTYDRVFVASRNKVREFEQNVLTRQFMETHITNVDGDPVTAQTLKDLKAAAMAKSMPQAGDDSAATEPKRSKSLKAKIASNLKKAVGIKSSKKEAPPTPKPSVKSEVTPTPKPSGNASASGSKSEISTPGWPLQKPSIQQAFESASGPVFHDDEGIENSEDIDDDGLPFDVVDLGVEANPKYERVVSDGSSDVKTRNENIPPPVIKPEIEEEAGSVSGGDGGDDGGGSVHTRQNSVASSSTQEPAVDAHAGQDLRRQSGLSKLKKVTEGIKEGAFKNGFGFSSTTVSPVWNPFQSKVSSAKPKLGSFVVQEGAEPPKVPKTLQNAATRVGRTMPQEGAVLQSLKKESTISGAITSHFNGPANRKTALLASVMQLKEATGMTPGETTVLIKALAGYNKDTAQAERILQALPQVRLVDDLLNPRPAEEITADVQLAWAFAAEIEGLKGGKGLDLLSKITAKPDGAAEGAPALAATQRGPMRAYLRAAAEVARAAGQRAPALDPGSMFSHGKLGDAVRATPNGWPGRAGAPIANGASLTLAEKALLAVRDELDPAITEIHGCRFAVQMARGGMVTDKARNPDGTKSEFQKVESRASKTMGMHLNRAMAAPSGFQRIADTLRYGTLHHGKSPFYGYDAIVSSRGKNMGFELSHIGGIQEGRAMKDMVDVLESTLKARGGTGDGALPTAQNAVAGQALLDDHGAGGTLLRNMVRSEILQRAKTEALLLPRLARGDQLSESAIAQVRTAVLTAIELPASSSGTPEVEEQVQELLTAALAEQNVPLTPARLLAWAGDAGGPTDAESVQEMRTLRREEGQPDWKSFSTAFDRVANGQVSVPANTPIQGKNRAETAEILASMIRGEELGSGFSLANAGNTQATTRNISEVISGVLSGATMSVRADLGGGRTRIVSFESGVSTDRSSLRMSVSTVRRNQEGAGGSLGFRLGKKEVASFSASVGGDAGHSFELLEQEGAVFGFPRHKTGGVGGDRDLAQQKARLIKLLIGVPDEAGPYQAPGNKEDKTSLVKRAYQEFGDAISIGAFEVKQKDHRFTGSSSAGAGATIGNLRVGLPQESVAGETRLGTLEYKDTSGTLKVIRESESKAFKATVTGALASLSGLIEGATAPTPAPGEVAADAVTSMTSLAVANIGSIATDFFRDGETRTTTRILYDDQELPTSFATQTLVTNKEFVKNLAADVENFAEDKAKKFFPARHGADRDHAVQTEKKILGEFAGQLRDHRDLTGTSQLYWEWGPSHVEASNLLEADRELSEKLGDKIAAKHAKRDIDTIHKDPGYREARFLINANEQSASDIKGVNGMLGVRHDVRTSANVRSLNFT